MSGESSFRQQLAQWLPGSGVWDICWHASRDGWAASRFHKGCDDKGPTVTIVQVGRYIFGGYTDVSWAGVKVDLNYHQTQHHLLSVVILCHRNNLTLLQFDRY